MTTNKYLFYFDVSCVHSYLGFTQLIRTLLGMRGVGRDANLDLRPLLIAPDAPVDRSVPLQEVHRRDFGPNWSDMEAAMSKRAEAAETPINFDRVQFTSTVAAHVAVQHVQSLSHQKAQEFLGALFRAYFVDGELVSNVAWLRKLVQSHGLPEPTFSFEEQSGIQREVDNAHSEGIRTAPTMVVPDGSRFTGALSQAEYAAIFSSKQ